MTIPNSVASIGDYAFEYCSGLTSVTIPNSVTSIGGYAFYRCSGLTNIKVDATNKYYDSRNDCNAIINSTTNELVVGCKNTIIPNSVTSIGEYAFFNCSGLTSVTIPNSVTSIGAGAFLNCSGLTSVTIPNGVTSIGRNAFDGCKGLTSVTIPNSVTSIGASAFYRCSCIKDFINLSSVPQSDAGSLPTTATVHVLKGCKSAYSASSVWSAYNIVEDAENFLPKNKCAAPVITFVNGKIHCVSETESATCHYNYDITNNSGSGEDDGDLTSKLVVTAYATAEEHHDSETVTETFDLNAGSGMKGDINGDGKVTMADANEVVNIYLGK